MKGVQALAARVTTSRRPAAADNPFLALQAKVSGQIIAALDSYRDARDKLQEQIFFGFYGSRVVQAFLGINVNSIVRPVPEVSPETLAARKAQSDAYVAMLETGGFDEALTRAVLYVMAADHVLDQRCALALNVARQQLMHLPLADFKILVRDQFFVLQLEPGRAIDALHSLVPEADARGELLKQVRAIASAGDPLSAAVDDRLAELSRALAVPRKKPTPATPGRSSGARATVNPDPVLH